MRDGGWGWGLRGKRGWVGVTDEVEMVADEDKDEEREGEIDFEPTAGRRHCVWALGWRTGVVVWLSMFAGGRWCWGGRN